MLIRFKAYGMVAKSALMSHKDIDYDKAAVANRGQYREMVMAVDYVGKGREHGDVQAEERQAFVDKYLALRKRAMKDVKDQNLDKGDGIEIKKVGV